MTDAGKRFSRGTRIYASTACVPGTEPLTARLGRYRTVGIRHVELGAGVKVDESDLASLHDGTHNFVLHNYFPPPSRPFVLNLASPDAEIRRRSMDLAKRALKVSEAIRAPMYSIHAGFVTDPIGFDGSSFELPTPVHNSEVEAALTRYIEAIATLAGFATRIGVELLIENNVCPPHLAGKLLLQTPEEFIVLFERLNCSNVGILLDTGHLNVSATTLGFDREAFMDVHRNRIRGLHLHDNDGNSDQHLPPDPKSWLFQGLRRISGIDGIPIIVEARFSDEHALADYIKQLPRLIEPDVRVPYEL